MKETVHASTVAIEGRAVLMIGPSGAGKSDLALRLIDRGAMLVSDDYTDLFATGDMLIARPPATIAGKIEVRGLGILDMPYLPEAPVALVVRLGAAMERMPDAETYSLAERAIPSIALNPFEASAPIRIELAMRRMLSK